MFTHVLYCLLTMSGLAPSWIDDLDPKIIAPINGPDGFRSDNGSFIFKLFVADEKTK